MKQRINPFNPNSIVTPTLFAGRDALVFQIIKKLAQVREGMPASFVLQGDRGIGKTALAKLVMYDAEQNKADLQNLRFLTGYYVVEKDQTFESVLQASLNLMTDKMPETLITRLSQRLGTFFKNGKFSFGAFGANVGYDGSAKESKDSVIKDRAISAFSNIIAGLDEIKESERKLDGVFVVIDEIHNLKDVDGAAQILRAIATTLDVNGHGKISFMVLGYTDGIERFFSGDPSARRHFDVINLTVMPRNEAKEILVKGFEKAKVSYNEMELDRNIEVAGGYPHSIQVIGHQLLEVDEDNHIDDIDWKNALELSTEELARKDFSEMYDFKGKGTLRETILNILALSGPKTKQQLRDYVDGKNIYTEAYMGSLKKSGAVQELQDGTITLHSMLFRAAILIHLYTHSQTNKSFEDLIKRFSKEDDYSKKLPESNKTSQH